MEKLNKFMKNVFPTLEPGEHISIVRINDNKTEEIRCKNIDEAVSFCNRKDKYFYNSYFSLATTDGGGRRTENLKSRSCLCWDFDKKTLGADFNVKDILHLFKSIRLYYHAIIDSGHGYHVYVFIEPTTNLETIESVQRAVAVRLGADVKATLKTQLMRLPGTVNIKHGDKLPVKIVYLAEDEKTKRLPISHYQRNYVTERYKTNNTNISWVMRDNFTPKCVKDILERGSEVGNRNTDLQIIVVALKRMGKSEAEIRAVVSEWLENTEKMDDLDYQLHYMYKNLYNGILNCKDCPYRSECYVVENIGENVTPEGYPILAIPNRDVKLIANSRRKRKGVKFMNGNMIVIYTVLMNHRKGLYRNELVEELSYRERDDDKLKCCFSDNTITKTLNELHVNGFIDITTEGRRKFIKLKSNRVSEDLKIRISYASTYECIKGDITPTELELYCYMKYLNKITPRKRGEAENALTVTQEELARDLGVDQSRVAQMISNLLGRKLLSINYRGRNRSGTYMYNSYLLNY